MSTVKVWPSSFTPAQYEVVNMVSCLKRESDVVALKSILVGFINERLQGELDHLYEDGTLSDDKMSELAGQHLRTPYGAEVHKIRQEISRRFDGDLETYSKSLNQTYPGFRVARINPVRAFTATT